MNSELNKFLFRIYCKITIKSELGAITNNSYFSILFIEDVLILDKNGENIYIFL